MKVKDIVNLPEKIERPLTGNDMSDRQVMAWSYYNQAIDEISTLLIDKDKVIRMVSIDEDRLIKVLKYKFPLGNPTPLDIFDSLNTHKSDILTIKGDV